MKADYSLITIGPSVTPGRSIAILGGLDTTGTEGATMFATSSFGIEQLEKALDRLGNGGKGDFPPFQALVRIDLAKGYQVLGADLVSLHLLPSKSRYRSRVRLALPGGRMASGPLLAFSFVLCASVSFAGVAPLRANRSIRRPTLPT